MPTLEELTQRIAALETSAGIMSSMSGQIGDVERQLQRLQGGGGLLEPQSSISAYDETPPFVLATAGNPVTTYVGQATQLLAGRNVLFERVINSPFLRISTGAGLMNADYVVDSNGFGTHLTLFGTTGAFADAIATGGDRCIWICTTHTETVSSQTSLTGLSVGQRILIFSAGPNRPYIVRGFSGALFSMSTASGTGAGVRFEGVQFTTSSGTGSQDWVTCSTGVQLPDIEMVNVGFDASSGTSWAHLVNIASAGSATAGRLYLWGVQDLSGTVLSIVKLASSSASSGSFWMEECEFTGLSTISDRTNTTDADWGLGSSNQQLGIHIRNNRLNISSYGWKRSYLVPFVMIGNHIRGTHSSSYIVDIGPRGASGVAQTNQRDVTITGNYIICTVAGGSVLHVDGEGGTASAITCAGNTLAGPGSGTAIQLDIAGESTTDGYYILNSYRDWGTNVGGTGASSPYPTIDHGALSGLADDDHTRYIDKDGTRNLTGNWEASTIAEGWYIQAAKFIIDDSNHWLDTVITNGASANFGYTTIGGTLDTISAGEQNGSKFTMAQNAAITTMSAYVDLNTLTRTYRICVYSDVAGVPTTLLAYTADITATTTAAWQTSAVAFDGAGAAITSLDLASGSTYWVTIHVNGGGGFSFILSYDAAAAGTSYTGNADTFSGGPETPWVGGTAAARQYSAYVTGTPNTTDVTWNVASGDSLVYSRDNDYFSFKIAAAEIARFSALQNAVTGYFRVGSLAAPTNITAGDFTTTRLSVGDGTALGATTGLVIRMAGTLTSIAGGANVFQLVQPTLSPSSNSSSDFRALNYQMLISDTNARTFATIQSGYFENRVRQTGTISRLVGMLVAAAVADSSSPATIGTISTLVVFEPRIFARPTGTSTVAITTGYGIDFGTNFLSDTPGGGSATFTNLTMLRMTDPTTNAITTLVGIDLAKFTRGTNNIEFRNAGKMVYTPTSQTVVAATTIPNTARVIYINSDGAVTLTSTPNVATTGAQAGQFITIVNNDSADAVTLRDETALVGSKLRLPGAADLVLGIRDSVTFVYEAVSGEWWALAAANN